MRFLLALTLAVACIGTDAAGADTRFGIGYTPSYAVAPIFIGKEQGFFAKRGLDVQLQPGNGSVLISGLVSGSLQASNPTTATVLQAVDNGIDLVMLAGIGFTARNGTDFGVVVRNGAAIDKPQDYAGKRVAVSTIGAFLHILFVDWLQKNGVDPKSVTFVEIPFPQMNDVLKQGTVDAAIPFEPFVSRIVQAGTARLGAAFAADVPDGLPMAIYAGERRWVEAHPDAVRAFREAIAEGMEFMKSHPKEARADANKYLKLPPAVLAGLAEPKLNMEIPVATIAEWIRIMRAQGLIKGNPDPARLVLQ
jgi:NitT/TauT family transport system substrate-binding protein